MNAAIETALLQTIAEQGRDATVSTVIRAVSTQHPFHQSEVRGTYWSMVADGRIKRSPDGHVELLGTDRLDVYVERAAAGAPPLPPRQRLVELLRPVRKWIGERHNHE